MPPLTTISNIRCAYFKIEFREVLDRARQQVRSGWIRVRVELKWVEKFST